MHRDQSFGLRLFSVFSLARIVLWRRVRSGDHGLRQMAYDGPGLGHGLRIANPCIKEVGGGPGRIDVALTPALSGCAPREVVPVSVRLDLDISLMGKIGAVQ